MNQGKGQTQTAAGAFNDSNFFAINVEDGKPYRVLMGINGSPNLIIPLNDFIAWDAQTIVARPVDVPYNHWAERAIAYCLDRNYMSLDAEGKFCGNDASGYETEKRQALSRYDEALMRTYDF